MIQHAFRMQLYPGKEHEYERRHNEIWPELSSALLEAGIQSYSIWLDKPSGYLFAYMQLDDTHAVLDLPQLPIVKKWWAYMADIMHTNADNSPVAVDLSQMFRLRAD